MVQVSDVEIKTLIGGFSNATVFQQSGVTVAGTKYMYLQSDDNQIQAKKGATGVSIAKAGKCESLQHAVLVILVDHLLYVNKCLYMLHSEKVVTLSSVICDM